MTNKTLLHYRVVGDSGPVLYILHGLFGSSDNWQTISKEFAKHFQVVLVDQRNHGMSFKSDVHSYDAMAEDLKGLIDNLGHENPILLGHSMGGKTVMRFAQLYPNIADKIIVVDIGPKGYPPHHQSILAGLSAIDFTVVNSRSEAENILKEYVSDFMVRQFLLKNVYWVQPGKQLGWRINVPVLNKNIEQITGELASTEVDTKTLFIRGVKSNYIVEPDFVAIKNQFRNAEISSIADAGHWIHAEQPERLFELVKDFAFS